MSISINRVFYMQSQDLQQLRCTTDKCKYILGTKGSSFSNLEINHTHLLLIDSGVAKLRRDLDLYISENNNVIVFNVLLAGSIEDLKEMVVRLSAGQFVIICADSGGGAKLIVDLVFLAKSLMQKRSIDKCDSSDSLMFRRIALQMVCS